MLVRKRYNLGLRIKIVVLLALILGGAGYIVFYSPVFKIAEVNVAIAGSDAAKFSDLIGPDPHGQNLIFWSPLLNAGEHPEIKDLKITKNYFNRSIEVTGSIRNKKIIWCFIALRDSKSETGNTNKCFWTDETGYIFAEAPTIEGAAIKMVNDYRPAPLGLGDIVLPTEMFNNLNSVLNILTEFNLPVTDVRLEDIKLREFAVNLEHGPKIIFSLEADPEFIKPAISSLMKSNSWSKINSLNLTVEGRAYPSF